MNKNQVGEKKEMNLEFRRLALNLFSLAPWDWVSCSFGLYLLFRRCKNRNEAPDVEGHSSGSPFGGSCSFEVSTEDFPLWMDKVIRKISLEDGLSDKEKALKREMEINW